MARRRPENSIEEPVTENKVNETLSQETPEVQEAVLKDLVGETTVTDSEPVTVDMPKDELPEEVQNMHVEVKEEKEELKAGDRVKIKPDVGNDIVGRRIHNGIKNYLYTVKNVRDDGYVNIECLTYIFTLHKKDLEVIKRG